ncbi:Recombination protein N (DNA repair protein RecN) [Candidatus Glomeribacter gigasporarum BEG34]|uniref:DNA repair protein RecN n=1 Tax=Candidatus Glomeribacter gigasporarum BEG34 TaxID=1070319 RepID=G2J961_9BURK|nr:DNA repair protein RecN [Candidatus Glomeribacter gigasporarum]CCD29308.1 Recombination protein N (DNA repair protein RecN) [Candidatus Glomeribacter gigasporarum BEG34]
MLRRLSIQDFVIVTALDMEFEAGLTVFSGETGAGKSILIDALSLLCGARAEADVIRAGCARAQLSAEFELTEPARRCLAAQALDTETEPNAIQLRRAIDCNGRSRAFINGTPVALAQLREIGAFLVDIHGQHAHQQVLRAQVQRALLDDYANAWTLAEETAHAWRAWRAALDALRRAADAVRETQLEREQLVWQLSELDALAPAPNEWETVNAEHRRLSHAADLSAGLHGALDALSNADHALLARLGAWIARIRELAQIDEALNEALAALESAEIQLREAVYVLSHYSRRVEPDPQPLAQLSARLEALHMCARKLRIPPGTLSAEHAARRARLAVLDAAVDTDALQTACTQAKERYNAVAQRLSNARAQAARTLSAAVTQSMQTLAMPGGCFEAALIPLPEGNAHGLEQIEFRIAAHPGAPLRPLAKIVSGGELARIGLALAVIARSVNPNPTLIFDEVDSGIGGAVAEVVGRLLRQLAQRQQILCVTHLPQVAVCADTHWRAAKERADGQTVSDIVRLDQSGRIEEIARMLGGIQITQTTRQHAEEMLRAGK